MAIYRFINNYRGINKTRKGETSQYPPFHVFKRGDLVNAEQYNPDDITGVKFAKQMILVMESYIVPSTVVRKLENDELAQAYAELGYSEQAETPMADNEQVMDVAELPEEKAKIIENLHKSTMMDYGKNYGMGALFGGIAGFGVAYYMKKNKIIGSIIGITAGVFIQTIFSKKNKSI